MWMGTGLVAFTGIHAGDTVTEAQMAALFGKGHHPDADAITAAVIAEQLAAGATVAQAERAAARAVRLGNPFRVHTVPEGGYRHRVAEAFGDWNTGHGQPRHAPVPEAVRARIRTEVAVGMFTTEHGRAPRDERERSGWIARNSRPARMTVCGFDLTFSPVKSVSTLWALAPRELAERIEAAHHAAVADALAWLDQHAAYTRLGRNGIRQVETEGLISTWFTHRDSRAGDPDLHTHVTVPNKVRTRDGRWLALDARMLYRHKVTASEVYNTSLIEYVTRLGVRFTERPGTDADKRPVHEIVGIDSRLNEAWSKRGSRIRARTGELATVFQAEHGREPVPVEVNTLAAQANLETRPRKHTPRSLAEQRADWRAEARTVLGSDTAVESMLAAAQAAPATTTATPVVADAAWIDRTARRVLARVEASRATWAAHHITAETQRALRALALEARDEVAERVTAAALALSVPVGSLAPVQDSDTARTVAGVWARSDGSSVYTVADSTVYTSPAILASEARLLAAADATGGRTVCAAGVDAAITGHTRVHPGRALTTGQQALVREFATSGRRLQVAVAPAGTGKTTAMRVFADAWRAQGGPVVGLAPTAAAAATLQTDLGAPVFTIDKLTHTLARATHATDTTHAVMMPDWVRDIDASTVVVIDEAAKAATATLDTAVSFLLTQGASVRLIGDDRQLASVAAGGVVRDLAHHPASLTLSEVMRFSDAAERAASLALREGDPAAVAFYTDNDRVHVGTLETVTHHAYRAWQADITAGHDAVLLAPTRALVTELNARARADRLTGIPPEQYGPQATLSDGLAASTRDIVCTRRNHPGLRLGHSDYVRNGYRWHVQHVHDDGRLTVRHLGSRRVTTLPAAYVRTHTTLGYASTIDTAQGITADTCHGVLTGTETRARAYVMLTRGRHRNHAWIATAPTDTEPAPNTVTLTHPGTGVEALTAILSHEDDDTSATTITRQTRDPARRLGHIVDAYLDALGLAAEHLTGPDTLAVIDHAADTLVPGLTDQAAYPVLRQHLCLLALDGQDPVTALAEAVSARELDTAHDIAAVLDWRLDPTGRHSHHTGPLPWLPDIPQLLRTHPLHGPHLHAQARDITATATAISTDTREWTSATAPEWARPYLADTSHNSRGLIAELALWRAGHHVRNADHRPTGPVVYPTVERRHQHTLDHHATHHITLYRASADRWTALARQLDARLLADPYWPVLAGHLTNTSAGAAGANDLEAWLRHTLETTPLPDEQPAAALRWRLARLHDQPHPDTEPTATAPDPTRTFLAADPLRRLSDTDLTEHIRRLDTTRTMDQSINAVIRHNQHGNLTDVRERHQRLDTQAAAIRAATQARTRAATLAQQVRDSATALKDAQAQPCVPHNSGVLEVVADHIRW
jgi:conjugative relaxase-like TrwC/TraI family protein